MRASNEVSAWRFASMSKIPPHFGQTRRCASQRATSFPARFRHSDLLD